MSAMNYQINEHFDEQEKDLSFQEQIAAEQYFDGLCDLVEEQIEISKEWAIYNGEYDEENNNEYLMTTSSYDDMLDYLETRAVPENLESNYYEEEEQETYIPGPVEPTFYDLTPFTIEKPTEETAEEKQAKIEAEKQKALEEYAKNNKHNWTLPKELRGIESKPKKKSSKSQKRKNRRRKFKINKNFPSTM